MESNQTYYLGADQVYTGIFPAVGTQLSVNDSLLTLVDAIRGYAIVQLMVTINGTSTTCDAQVFVSFSSSAFLLEPTFNQIKYIYVPFMLKWPIVPPFSTSDIIRIDLVDPSGNVRESVVNSASYGDEFAHFRGVSNVYPHNFYLLNVTIGSHGPFMGGRIKVEIR